jgi:hypothetical protein
VAAAAERSQAFLHRQLAAANKEVWDLKRRIDDADATASAASELKRASAEASESFRVAFDMEDFPCVAYGMSSLSH